MAVKHTNVQQTGPTQFAAVSIRRRSQFAAGLNSPPTQFAAGLNSPPTQFAAVKKTKFSL